MLPVSKGVTLFEIKGISVFTFKYTYVLIQEKQLWKKTHCLLFSGFCSSDQDLVFLSGKMRLKEIQRTAHQAWSPAGHHPMYLALGTAAQQLDASFSTTAALEIFEMDFSDPSLEMQLKGSFKTPNR